MGGRKLTQGQKKRNRQRVEQARLDERHKVVTAMNEQRPRIRYARYPIPQEYLTNEQQPSQDNPPNPPLKKGGLPAEVAGVLLVSENNGVLVNNWRQGWRWFSNLALGAIVAINTAPLPPEVLAALPPDAQSKVTIGLAVLGIVGRFVNQAKRAEVLHDPTA